MMKNNRIVWCLAFLMASPAVAQEQLPSDTFRVVKAYQPTIRDADKIDFQIEINDTMKLETEPTYDFIHKTFPLHFDIEAIQPAKIKGEPLVKLYNGYARLGVGNVLIPFGEIYYNSLRSKEYSIGAHAKYFNMRELNKIEGSDRMNAHVEVFGKRFWKTNTLSANLGFDMDRFTYYGQYQIASDNNIELPESDLEQQYQRFSAQANLKSTIRDSFNLRHEADLNYQLLSNREGNTEHNIRGDLNLSQFVNTELYELDVFLDYNQYDFDNENTIFGLKPQISTIGERFKIKVGLGVYMNANENADFHFYPLAELKYNVIEDVLVPYAGLKGEIRRLNYQEVTKENLFVSNQLDLANSNEKYNLYAGVRGTLSSKLSFNLSGAILRTDNDYLYVQLPDTNQLITKDFYLTYDQIDEIQLKGELNYQLSEQIKIFALAEYFNFDTENEAEAWHRPELKMSLSGRYNLRDKIILTADLFYWGEQKARGIEIEENPPIRTIDFPTRTLPAIFDANLGIEYRYTKRFSAFIDFTNLTGINYEKYQNYPLQGFSVWGGFTYGF